MLGRTSLLFVLAVLGLSAYLASACTVLFAGKKATASGSVLVSHSSDGGGTLDPRLIRVGSKKNSKSYNVYTSPEEYPRYVGYERGPVEYYPLSGSNQTPFKSIGTIMFEKAMDTFDYFEETYSFINKYIGLGESTCSSVFVADCIADGGKALLSIDEMARIAVERTTSARQAVQTIGDLAVKYGFYGPGSFEGGAESLIIADANEGWVFHVLPDDTATSAIWVAQRVPDEHVTVVANMFIIRDVNLTDTANFLGSENMYSIAQTHGWWTPGQTLDFTKTFSGGEYAHVFYSGRRMWRAMDIVAPSLKLPSNYTNLRLEKVYPFSVKPDEPVTLDTFRTIHRDYLKGTPFDMTKGLAAGPFGTPDRWTGGPNEPPTSTQLTITTADSANGHEDECVRLNVNNASKKFRRITRIARATDAFGSWERVIGLHRIADTYIAELRKDSIGNIAWFGPHAPHATVFVPFPIAMTSLPASYTSGIQLVLNKTTAFWAHRYVHNFANLRYAYIGRDVRENQSLWETRGESLVNAVAAKMNNRAYSTADVTKIFTNFANEMVSAWWELSDHLMYKYSDGYLNEPDLGHSLGYPKWWLEVVGYYNGPPPPQY